MSQLFTIDEDIHIPIYKQILAGFESAIESGELQVGGYLPSMNELASMLNISKETAKKVYSILRERGLIDSIHGKGFFVLPRREEHKLKIFMLLDKLSQYTQILYDSFVKRLGSRGEVTIYLYNQDINAFEDFIGRSLDEDSRFDYYLVTPHFPLDATTQARALKAMKRIPNRKLVMLDKWMRSLPGNYGAVYQDMTNDIYDCLGGVVEDLRRYNKMHVVTLPSSLYAPITSESVTRFAKDNDINIEFHYEINEDIMQRDDVYLLLNGQLGIGLAEIARIAKAKGLDIGKDIGLIAYNESYLNEIILGGLTTVSTDFKQMGYLAADMILAHNLHKIHCDFKMTRRNTF